MFRPLLSQCTRQFCTNFFTCHSSLRRATLRGEVRNYLSGGESSVIDRDVDDVIALLNGTLANYPAADATRIVVTGGSRGGGVSHLLSVRDERIKGAAIYYGATNHLHESIATAIRTAMETGQSMQNQSPAQRWMPQYTIPRRYTEFKRTRLALIRRSAYFFADRMPVQVHHGTDDRAVPVVQSEVLGEKMHLQPASSTIRVFFYPGGVHSQ